MGGIKPFLSVLPLQRAATAGALRSVEKNFRAPSSVLQALTKESETA